MNAGAIWWGQLGNSLRLLTNVVNTLRDCRSAVLQVPGNLPWRQDFYEAIDLRRAGFSGEKRLIRLAWEGEQDPGELVLDELCSMKVRADYWPGMTYAQYLGSRDDILLNDYYVWITGIETKSALALWMEFVSQYERTAEARQNRAVFILEYQAEEAEVSDMEHIRYALEHYDCRVFSLEAAAELNNVLLRNYQAELALCICGNDPQLCCELLRTGEKLLSDPVRTTREVLATGVSAEGKPFAPQTEQQIESEAWEAAVVLMFPILERYRMGFIRSHEAELKRHLPISNSNGERVEDPYDLELGALCYIASISDARISLQEAENLRHCRKVRNLLAHNDPVSLWDARKVFFLASAENG